MNLSKKIYIFKNKSPILEIKRLNTKNTNNETKEYSKSAMSRIDFLNIKIYSFDQKPRTNNKNKNLNCNNINHNMIQSL